jgi:hypothetical protein
VLVDFSGGAQTLAQGVQNILKKLVHKILSFKILTLVNNYYNQFVFWY